MDKERVPENGDEDGYRKKHRQQENVKIITSQRIKFSLSSFPLSLSLSLSLSPSLFPSILYLVFISQPLQQFRNLSLIVSDSQGKEREGERERKETERREGKILKAPRVMNCLSHLNRINLPLSE